MFNLYDWKQQLKQKPQIGCFVTFASPAITEFTARLGFDFTLIDNEHGCMNQETIEDMVRASQACSVPAIVRVPYNRAEASRRALDFGANGVQIPLVNEVAEAKEVVAYTHFPPLGERGVAFLTRAANYGMYPDKAEYIRKADQTKLVAIHIETVEAIKNLDKLLQVDGIDVFFIGPGDLAISMGFAHNPNAPEVISTINQTLEKISSAGRIAGTYVADSERAKQVIDCGANYLVTALTQFMIKGAKELLHQIRS